MEETAAHVQKELESLLLGNSLQSWAEAGIVVLVCMLVIVAIKWIAIHRLKAMAARTSFRFDDAIVAAMEATQIWLLFFPACALAMNWLELPDRARLIIGGVATIAGFLQAGIWATAMAADLIQHSRKRAMETNIAAATSLSAMAFLSKLVIWSLIVLLMLDNLGIDVTALVAGLGVGGVAVALATQNILGDLFASLSIIVDKPFEIGDFIIVGDYMGSVENIGMKTTRLRSLSGEQIVCSNSDLLSSRVRNYKRMFERRIVFSFGVLYQTTPDELEKIGPIVKDIITGLENVRFDRAHFASFGDSSLNFEVVYYVLSGDYTIYMDIQQAINLALMRRLAEMNVGFAYPTRTLFVDAPIQVEFKNPPPGADTATTAPPARAEGISPLAAPGKPPGGETRVGR